MAQNSENGVVEALSTPETRLVETTGTETGCLACTSGAVGNNGWQGLAEVTSVEL